MAVVVGLMAMMGESIQPNEFTRYTSVTGFFEQDDPNTVASSFDYVRSDSHHVYKSLT